MNAPPFPLNPSVGQWWQNWIWNGANWVCSQATGVRVITTTFTASGPYQPSPGLVSLVVECIGGGGAGGNSGNPQGVTTFVLGGGGGGSGGYSRITLAAALVAGGVNVTIGAGGDGLSSGPVWGQDGQATTFGAFCVANGGKGGQLCDASSGAGLGGDGAEMGTGDVTFSGASGNNGMFLDDPGGWVTAAGGMGGVTFGGNRLNASPSNSGAQGGNADPGTGAGGGGAILNQVQGTGANQWPGGSGGSGLCVVTEYCWADAGSGVDDCVDPTARNLNINARVAMVDDWKGGPGPRPPGPCGPGRPPVIGPFGGEDWDDGQS